MVENTEFNKYERVKSLLEDFYKAGSSLTKGGIEVRLEEYSLNGREIILLIEELEIHTKAYECLEKNRNDLEKEIEKYKELIKELKEIKESSRRREDIIKDLTNLLK